MAFSSDMAWLQLALNGSRTARSRIEEAVHDTKRSVHSKE